MSEKVNRRRVLTAGAAGVAVAAASVPALASASPEALTSPRIERLRKLAARVVVLEALPGGDAEDEALAALYDQVAGLAEEIYATPVNSQLDIIERAMVAQSYWADSVGPNGKHVMAIDESRQERSAQHLILAVLQLVGAPEGGAYV